ncbi:MAG: hypothetical protein NXY57DRAFT_967003 [Lentinula lateritia]|nr:MAG: hypothetical protein NXY57DRAFT_967003 [Lentinula lateritia]
MAASTNNRFIAVGPETKDKSKNYPGLFDSMPFRHASSSPFPIFIECPDYASARFVHSRLQPWFKDKKHWDRAPRLAATGFVDSEEFKDVSGAFESQGKLIWTVKLGRRAGIYSNTVEALNSVDASGANKVGKVFQLAYAFYSFREAVLCQMLNDKPRTPVHVYEPSHHPDEAAALRSQLLNEEADTEHEEPQPSIISDSDSDPDSPQPPSPPAAIATPKRRPPPSTVQLRPGFFNINIAPSIAVRVNSEPSPGRLSPTKQKIVAQPRGVELGWRLLEADRFSDSSRKSIEEVLISCTSVEDFVDAVADEDGALNRAKAALVWDLYKLVFPRKMIGIKYYPTILLPAAMAIRKSTGFARFLNASTCRKATSTRRPWRVRTKQTPLKLTPQERAQKKLLRKQEKVSYQEAIADAHQQIYSLAAEICGKFPKFSLDHVTADIFQSERLKVSSKDGGPYAAFSSAEAKRINEAEVAANELASFLCERERKESNGHSNQPI